MFTGIIETTAELINTIAEGTNLHLDFKSNITAELKIDQSVAHNGVCLTVVDFPGENIYRVTAIDETLKRTNLGQLKTGSSVNLERCMKLGDRLDGHMVQGHVDTTGVVKSIQSVDGSWNIHIEHPIGPGWVTVPKGSICVNGTSLTVVDSESGLFSISLIPYTFENTNFKHLKVGDQVNLEFDILGKYIARLMGQSSVE